MRTALFILLLLVCAGSAQAQVNRDNSLDVSGNPRNPQSNPANPADELRYRAAIRHEEETYQEMVERAAEIGDLSSQLADNFDSNKGLSRDDLKRLERIEKLARKIRGNSGGSDGEKANEDSPAELKTAVMRLTELSEKLNEGVKKTSRMIVSATVIERSNELIELVKVIRGFVRP